MAEIHHQVVPFATGTKPLPLPWWERLFLPFLTRGGAMDQELIQYLDEKFQYLDERFGRIA
jgi:hypothetical protein